MQTKHLKLLEAVASFKTAVEELDQAHAVLKDIGLDRVVDNGRGGIRNLTFDQANSEICTIFANLLTWQCDECGQPLAEHDGRDGTCNWGGAK